MLLAILLNIGFWALIWGLMFGIGWLAWAGGVIFALGVAVTWNLYSRRLYDES